MSHRPTCWLLAALTSLVLASTARGATFDLIWADHLVVTNPGIAGFSLAPDVVLLVNKGSTEITSDELQAATISVHSSNPAVTAICGVENWAPPTTPVHSNEAVGNVSSLNAVLTTQLLPDETLHDRGPVFSFFMRFPSGFLGSVALDLTMTIGANQAHYAMLVDFTPGDVFTIEFPSASRVSSAPLATPAVATTWGRLKSLYR